MGLTVTVKQLNMYVKNVLVSDNNLRGITVKGEISNFICNARSGHAYFTLKDSDASVKCVMFASAFARVKFDVKDGLAVFLQGNVNIYERDGVYQLYVDKMTPSGMGAEYLAFLQLKEKLENRGLFDISFKKPLPRYPSVIGLITSVTGAAVKDFCSICKNRCPSAEIIIYPATVQGEGCGDSVIAGIDYFDNRGVDVICITRGGGSYEDLACFNDERIATAVFRAKTPVVSAIGHEIDFTVIDFVADVRAATPSNAAEIICPSSTEMRNTVDLLYNRIGASMQNRSLRDGERLNNLSTRLLPSAFISENEMRLDRVSGRINASAEREYLIKKQHLEALASGINAMNPLNVLLRGYAVASVEGKTVTRASRINKGDNIKLRFTDGVIDCVADKKTDL